MYLLQKQKQNKNIENISLENQTCLIYHVEFRNLFNVTWTIQVYFLPVQLIISKTNNDINRTVISMIFGAGFND